MIKAAFLLMATVFFLSCQQKPTKSIQETTNIFKPDTTVVDTRSSFLYTSFHITGSVNLSVADFLILKNPKTKTRILDPDLNQIIERLAKKGISPDRKIVLLSTEKDSIENKKWKWLLKNLEVDDVELSSVDDFNKAHKNARFAEPPRGDVWTLKISDELKNEFIIKKGKDCFVNWNEKLCAN
ncbi:MAG: rhodanese-like domain-containing protein [Pseudobdellovibrio sp.]